MKVYFLKSHFALKLQSSFVKYSLRTGHLVGGRRLNKGNNYIPIFHRIMDYNVFLCPNYLLSQIKKFQKEKECNGLTL